jgi:hypothetical protein
MELARYRCVGLWSFVLARSVDDPIFRVFVVDPARDPPFGERPLQG